MMRIHQLDGYIQSIYLVEYPHGLLLLDGCCRSDITLIKHFITHTLRRSFHDLKIICVTHMHPDHAGAAHRLRHLTGARIVSVAQHRQWYAGLDGLAAYIIDQGLALYVGHRLGKPIQNLLYNPYLKADDYVQEGDTLPVFDDWQVVDTRGHTDRDISLWHAATRQLYVADVLIKLKSKYVAPFPLYLVEQYRHSLQKILNLKPETVILAHGGMQQISDAEWDHIIRHAPKRRRTVADTVRHKVLWWSKAHHKSKHV